MKLLTINQARALWLFPLAELNPRGKVSQKDGLAETAQRYEFAIGPNRTDLVVSREKNLPLKFLNGKFATKTHGLVGVDMLIYRDGIVVDTRSSTVDSHAFIDDLLTWSSKEFGNLPHEEVVRVKYSISDVHVSSEHSLELLNPKLTTFAKSITGSARIPGANFELAAIGFWADQNLPYQPVPFRFERLQGAAFSDKRYYSQAPMDTEAHLSLLEKLEALLTA